MRHVCLTCKNHPELRWQCKEIAYTPGYGYNGSRNIFFLGAATGKVDADGWPETSTKQLDVDASLSAGGFRWANECPCPASDLVKAPEDEAIAARVWRRRGAEDRKESRYPVPGHRTDYAGASQAEQEAYNAGWHAMDKLLRAGAPFGQGEPGNGPRVGG